MIQFILFILTMPFLVHGEDTLRERLKERFRQRRESPAASTDVKSKIEKAGDYTFSLQWGGLKRVYKLHVPTQYTAKSPSPLLVVLHGGGGDMEVQATDAFYKQISKSEEEGSIAVFPNGVGAFGSTKLATWNAGKCCGGARDKAIDDVGFIGEVVKTVQQQLNIDAKHIYATGMSNGAMMAYRLACERPEVFAAIAAVAGTDNTVTCTPKNSISILHIHAKDDDHVLFNGGSGESFGDKSTVTDFTSVAVSLAKWVKLESCEPMVKRVLTKAGAYCDRYSKCAGGVMVELCVTDVGGHSWPGGRKPRNVGVTPSAAISANDVMWDFFKSVPPRN